MNQVIYVESRAHRLLGVMLVVLLHLLVVYVLAISLIHEPIKLEPEPIEMLIIQEVEEVKPEPKAEVEPTPVAAEPAVKPQTTVVEETPIVKPVRMSSNMTAPVVATNEVATTNAAPQQITAPVQAKGETHGVQGDASANCPTPKYPQAAEMREETGLVKLSLDVGVDGRVTKANVLKSSGSKDLDRAAMSAYKQCVFTPAMKDGVAIASTKPLAYDFVLND